MACPVCGRSVSVQKAITNSFGKQDIQDMLKRLREQRRKEAKSSKSAQK